MAIYVDVKTGGKTSTIVIPSYTKLSTVEVGKVAPSSGSSNVEIDTTSSWNAKASYIPTRGTIIVYSDHSVLEDGTTIPAIKMGDGLAYLVDLPFINQDLYTVADKLNDHIADDLIHVSSDDRNSWNNKLSCDIYNETLILE